MDDIRTNAQVHRAEELAQEYARREPDAVKLVDEFLAGAGVSIDALMVEGLVDALGLIERIDRLATIAENRRNSSLHEIYRRRPVIGEKLQRSLQEVEEVEFQEVETAPAKGEDAA